MIILTHEQNSPEWYAARRGLPTASEFSRIITPKTGKLSSGADAYIAELIDEARRPDQQPTFAGNRHTERGREIEPEALNWYRFAMDADVRECGLILNDARTAGASPDGLVYVSGELDRGIEVKAPEGKKFVLWRMQGGLPDEHKAQVHGGMVITGLERWDFLAYCDGYEPYLITVERDGYTELVAQAIDQFCTRLADVAASIPEAA